jgi:hypothetical protein
LGKTSVLAIWLLALAYRAQQSRLKGFPRRLAYVVNRRTVVDQTTTEAEELRQSLLLPELVHIADALRSLTVDEAPDSPLTISTLRGEFADNGEWRFFLRSVESGAKVAEQLRKSARASQVETLTGTQRGHERGRLSKSNGVPLDFFPSRIVKSNRRREPCSSSVLLRAKSASI